MHVIYHQEKKGKYILICTLNKKKRSYIIEDYDESE